MNRFKNFTFLGIDSVQEAQELKSNGTSGKLFAFIFLFPLLLGNWSCAAHKNLEEEKITLQGNKVIPKNILEEANIALSHYPELEDVKIEFRYKTKMKNSFMQAQPRFADLFKGKKDRTYYVLMSSRFLIENEEFAMADVPSEVLIGWLGHELGHIMDYREKSTFELVKFGTRYLTSEKFIKKAERTADTHAINHRMGNYIFATKDFILNHSRLADSYKARKARLYLSPQEILVMVNSLEEEPEELEEEES